MRIYSRYRFVRSFSLIMVVMLFTALFATPVNFGRAEDGQGDDSELSWDELWGDSEDAAGEEPRSPEAGYEEITANNKYSLLANMNTGLFALKDNMTGWLWHSVPVDIENDAITKGVIPRMSLRSQITIEHVFLEDETVTEQAHLTAGASAEVTVKKINDGIEVLYSFEDIGIVIPVEYVLEADGLRAVIKTKDIIEGTECFLTSVNLLPSFGAAGSEAEGYLFIPDGCGALVYFNNGVVMQPGYESMVYGRELADPLTLKTDKTEIVYMPVFGVVNGNEALTGIITEGDGAASIVALNGNERCGYNAVSSKLIYRVMSKQYNLFNKKQVTRVSRVHYNLDTYEVKYTPLTGKDASYTGMAAVYRAHLEEKGLTSRVTQPSLNINLIGSVDKPASFLGIPYTKHLKLTTFEQALDIVGELRGGGVQALSVRYLGWSNYGLFNDKIPNQANPMGRLGGKKDFNTLTGALHEYGFEFYPDVDLIQFRSDGRGVNKNRDSIRTPFRQIAYNYKYLRSVYATTLDKKQPLLLTADKIGSVADRYLKSFKKNGYNTISLSSMGNIFYSNLDPDKNDYRSALEQVYLDVFESFRGAEATITFEKANAYALPYAARVTATPVYSSGYDIFDRDVPFYQIVLHGVIPVSVPAMQEAPDRRINFLKAVETGSELLYAGMYAYASAVTDTQYNYLYGTTYTMWLDEALDYYKEYRDLLERVSGKLIVAHEQVEPDVFMTSFENGTQVLVNYNKEAHTVNGQRLEGFGFAETSDMKEGG